MKFILPLKDMPVLQLLVLALVLLLLVYNLYAFLLMGLDKLFAKYQKRRIPERKLLGMAKWFGAMGVYGGMRLFRHKTIKEKFKYVVVWLALQLVFYIAAGYFVGVNF